MKKVLSLVLSVIMVLSLSVPAFAASVGVFPSTNSVVLSEVQAKKLNLFSTSTDSVFRTASGEYFVKDGDAYVSVTKTDIPFSSPAALKSVLASDEYTPRLKEAIRKYYEYAVHENLTDEITMILYSSPGFFVDEEGTEIHFGKEMRYQVLDYGTTSVRNQELNEGLDTFAMADSAVNLSINAASLAVIGLGILNVPVATSVGAGITGVSAAKSILDIFRLAFPNKTFTGTTDDFAEITFHYHYYEKYISVNTDTLGWTDAVTTCKALVDLSKLRVCLYDEENLNMEEKWYDVQPFTVQGENYESPWQAAYNHMFFALYEPARIDVEDLTFDFGAFIWD